jgi:hypothetical protein
MLASASRIVPVSRGFGGRRDAVVLQVRAAVYRSALGRGLIGNGSSGARAHGAGIR